MNIKFKPFNVPNFVIQQMPPSKRQDGFRPSPSWPLSEIPAEDLAVMCDEFRKSVFKIAKKADTTPNRRIR